MINTVGNSNINPIQMFNATNAFKQNGKIEEVKAPEISEGLEINDNTIFKNQDLTEIKQFAKTAGEENLSNDDIQYGLTYGRSVIADYVV